jgi:hypothetical protein
MDSFFLFFPVPLSDEAMHQALLAFDFGSTILEPNYITAHMADARVWISLLNEQEIRDERSTEYSNTAIPESTLTMADIEVSRKENSDLFAIFLAERLILKYEGSVDWNGIPHWEQLYKGLQRWRRDHPEVRVRPPQTADSHRDTQGE